MVKRVGRSRFRSRRRSRFMKRRYRKGKMPLARVGLPNSVKIRHVYAEAFYLNPATYTDGYVFRINSLYDPNFTGVGGQPALYDNMSAMYRRYRVVGCKMKASFYNTTNDSVIVSILYQGNNSTIISDPNTYYPEGHKNNKLVNLDRVGTGGANKTFSTYFNFVKAEGREVLNSSNYAGVSADPNTGLYASVNAQTVSGGNLTIYARVQLTFYAIWDSTRQSENIVED